MENRKKYGDYYLGLDIGTDSVGWAAADPDYNLLRFNQKSMWGSRLFPEAKTAVERRTNRIARRRIQRRNQRLALLQDLFKAEICKKDPDFFVRLSESMLHEEDKTVKSKNSLFADPSFDDKAYHKKYPTIYHLRSELIHSSKPHDARLVYLAIHHIVKYRGHFLFEGDIDTGSSFDHIMQGYRAEVEDALDIPFICSDPAEMKRILCDRDSTKTDKQKRLYALFDCKSNTPAGALLKMITGASVKLKDVFPVSDEEEKGIKIEFGSDEYEQLVPRLEALLADDYMILAKAKAIHDWALLESIRHGHEYLSDAKKEIYEQHSRDLKQLKKLIKKYLPDSYDKVFKDPGCPNNYCAYSGTAKIKGKKAVIEKRCQQADFIKFLSGLMKDIAAEDTELEAVKARLAAGIFMPKLRTKDNSVVPNQLHLKELEMILKNASGYLPFLNENDGEGISVKDKILQILTFRIPYYVGPLNDQDKKAKNTWVVRRSHEKIYPWNFDDIVDKEMSAANFITRMTANCTYLRDQPVLPQNSLLYTRFMVLNELNNLKIDGEPIPVSLKQDIYTDCFEKRAKVTLNALVKYLQSKGQNITKDQITGIDGDFRATLKVWQDMHAILEEKFSPDIAEGIIRLSTVLGEDKKMLHKKLTQEYGKILTPEMIGKAAGKRYTGWGRLSAKLLTGIYDDQYDPETAEYKNIITAMWDTNENLMQLLGGEHGYAEAIQRYNQANVQDSGLTYQTVKDLYLSPSVKRSVWQTIQIVKGIKKIAGHDPKKVFIEMARGGGEKNKRTESRKSKLTALYKACKDESRDWIEELDAQDESAYRSDRLYLYYTQMGKCMYTGEAIDLDKIYDTTVYDIDHIYPRSKVKDDSLDNRVLVKRVVNANKTDIYPIDKSIHDKMHSFWAMLLEKGFISQRKYERLIRSTPLTDDELSDFVARQLVETRQSTKAVADILKQQMPETEIVYVKANLVSEFRQTKDMLKCREVKDLHHGKDAYLNIVVGNVYNTKFTRDPRNFFKERDHEYSLNQMYEFPVKRGNTVAWIPKDSGSIATVRKMMNKNNVLVTKMVFDQNGQLFDLNPVKKERWQLPLKKKNSCFTDSSKYGGYNSIKGTYFMLVEHTEDDQRKRSIVDMPLHMACAGISQDDIVKMLEKDKELIKPIILIDHIGINSLLEIDNCKMYLVSRTGNRIEYTIAHQLIMGDEKEKYLRKIIKYCDRADVYSQTHKKGILAITNHDEITTESNQQLYNLFVSKLTDTIYNVRLKKQATDLKNKEKMFKTLSLETQCHVLRQILNLFTSNKQAADLSELGLGKRVGFIRTDRCISNYQNAILINQSITGLFESKKDLLA